MNHSSRHPQVHRIAAAFLAALFSAPSSQAAETPRDMASVRLAIGSRARILVSSGDPKARAVMGRVTAIDEGSVTVETPGGALIRVPRAEIRSLQVSLEQRRRIKKGALIGAGVMGAVGAVFGAVSCGESNSHDRSFYYATECTQGDGAALLGTLFATSGAFWGGVIGYRTRSDDWIELPLFEDALPVASPSAPASPLVQGPPSRTISSPLHPGDGIVGLSPRLFAGARVQVLHDGRKTEGILVGISDEALTLAGSAGTIQIPRSAVGGLGTWGGERRRALKGALIGLVSGVALDFTSEPYCASGNGLPEACSRAASAAETAIGGAVIGAGIGLLVKATTWIPVSVNGLRDRESAARTEDLNVRVSPIVGRGRTAGVRLQVGW